MNPDTLYVQLLFSKIVPLREDVKNVL